MEEFYLAALVTEDSSDADLFLAIPAEDQTSLILEHFGLSESVFKKAFRVYADAFLKLWSNVKYDAEQRVIKADRDFEASEIQEFDEDVTYVTINGFISTDELSMLITNYDPVNSIPKKWVLDERTEIYLHPNRVEALYEELGVSGFDELFPTRADLKSFSTSLHSQCSSLLGAQYRLDFKDGQVIYLVDRVGNNIIIISDIPNALKRELASRLENRKNPVGSVFPRKDLFPMIVTRDLKGKELIRACNIDPDTNEQCNKDDFRLFKQRLRDEFRIDFDQNSHGYPDARTLYIQMHTLYAEFNERPYGGTQRIRQAFKGTPGFVRGEILVPPYIEELNPVKQFYVLEDLDLRKSTFVIITNERGRAREVIESPGAAFFGDEDGLEKADLILSREHHPRRRAPDEDVSVFDIRK